MSIFEIVGPYIPELLGVFCFIIGYIIVVHYQNSEDTETEIRLSELIEKTATELPVDKTLQHFDQYLKSSEKKEVKTFNLVLRACQVGKCFERAAKIFEHMRTESAEVKPNTESFEIYCVILYENKRYVEVIETAKLAEEGFETSEVLQTASIESFSKLSKAGGAVDLYEKSRIKEKIYVKLISCLIKTNNEERAISLLNSYSMLQDEDLETVLGLACKFECINLLQVVSGGSSRLSKNSYMNCVKLFVKFGYFVQAREMLLRMNESHFFDEGTICYFLDHCGKHGKFEYISVIFQSFLEGNLRLTVQGFNSLLDCCIKCQKYQEIWLILNKMLQFSIIPDTYTYTSLIKLIKFESEYLDLNKIFSFLDVLNQKKLFQIDEILTNCLLDACITAKRLDKALILFEELPKLDEISYNTLIKGFSMSKQLEKAVETLEKMKKNSVKPTTVTYNSIIDTCVRCSQVALAWEYLQEMQENGLSPDNFTYSTLVKGIKGENSMQELERIFKIIENGKASPDEVLFNCLIDACSRAGATEKCVELFHQMKASKIEASSVTYGIMIKAYGQGNMLQKALDIFREMSGKGLKANDVTYGCLLDACVKSGSIEMAQKLFVSMQSDGICPNTILYTTMIKGFSKSQDLEKALALFSEMKKSVQPNNVTYNSLLDCAVRCENLKVANQLFDEMRSVMLPDLITYSTMIKGLCKAGEVEHGLKILNNMRLSNIQPDEVLFNSLLDGCAKIGNLEIAETVYRDMKNLGIKPSNVTYSILVKLYGKNRQIARALEVLDDMKTSKVKPGIIVYTCLLQACIRCKQIHKALEIYNDMKREGVKGDTVTFNTLVNGCVYGKQLESAFSIATDSFGLGVKLAVDVYNNLVKNLVTSRLSNKMDMANEIFEKMQRLGVELDSGLKSQMSQKVNCENSSHFGGKKGHYKKTAMVERNFNVLRNL